MALLKEDSTHGYRIRYKLRSVDDVFFEKSRFFKSGPRARRALPEIENLEKLSSEKKLTARQIAYYLYKKLITVFDARLLTRERIYNLTPYEASIDETGRMF